jgi:hypothetical protein
MSGGGREVGRHKLRWMEDAENDFQGLKVNRWRKKASNRKQWVSVTTQRTTKTSK